MDHVDGYDYPGHLCFHYDYLYVYFSQELWQISGLYCFSVCFHTVYGLLYRILHHIQFTGYVLSLGPEWSTSKSKLGIYPRVDKSPTLALGGKDSSDSHSIYPLWRSEWDCRWNPIQSCIQGSESITSTSQYSIIIRRGYQFIAGTILSDGLIEKGYEDRTLEENLRTLMECGRYSPGVALIRSNPLYGTLSRFVSFLNNTVTNDQLSSVNLYYLIRSFWALPRIGCTYTSNAGANGELLHGNCHLVDVLLSKIMEYSETLTSTEWSILLKSIGKLRYSGDSDLLNQIIGTD